MDPEATLGSQPLVRREQRYIGINVLQLEKEDRETKFHVSMNWEAWEVARTYSRITALSEQVQSP